MDTIQTGRSSLAIEDFAEPPRLVSENANPAPPRQRVLVIDDEPGLLRLMGRTLERGGYHVTLASDGAEALRAFGFLRPALVVTDLVMPGTEGIEIILEIKRRDPSVKIVAVSGGGRDGPSCYLDLAAALGADRVLAKPFRLASLLEAVDQLLGQLSICAGP